MKLRARARKIVPITLTPESFIFPNSAPPTSLTRVVDDMRETHLMQGTNLMQDFEEQQTNPPLLERQQNDDLFLQVPHAKLTEGRQKGRKTQRATAKRVQNVDPKLPVIEGGGCPSKKRGRSKKQMTGKSLREDVLSVSPCAPRKSSRQHAKKGAPTANETIDLLPPPESIGNIRGQRRKRFTKEEKGKATIIKARQPRQWEPPVLVPNNTVGVLTRAKKSLHAQFQANADILEVLHVVPCHDYSLVSSLGAPELQHMPDSMATQNLSSLKYLHAREQSKHPSKPLTLNPVEANPDLYEAWDTSRAKWAVLVPNRFLSESSFHTGDTPTWTQGHVIGEYVLKGSGTKIFLCDLGDRIPHMLEIDCRIALGPHMTTEGSEAGHGYGWWKRTSYFNNCLVTSNGSVRESGDTVFLGDNMEVALAAEAVPIPDYEEPSDVEYGNGTQDSTARTTFPKVSTSLPPYFPCSGDDEEEAAHNSNDSSGHDWIPSWADCVSSSDDEVDDYIPPTIFSQRELDAWCRSYSSYKLVAMDLEQVGALYRRQSWNSTSVTLLGSRDNFTGPTPGYTLRNEGKVPRPEDVFLLYWSDETLEHIVLETNRYARAPLVIPNAAPKTKGGPTWIDTTVTELKGWFGICILMGVKNLPSIRHYWMRLEDFMYCELIAKVMTLARWDH